MFKASRCPAAVCSFFILTLGLPFVASAADGPIEITFTASKDYANPFLDVQLSAEFTDGHDKLRVLGYYDGDGKGGQAGRVFKIRFTPPREGRWKYRTTSNDPGLNDRSSEVTYDFSQAKSSGPIIVDPASPRRFIYQRSKEPFFHLGFTAYHLLDPTNDLAQIEKTLDYCTEHGFNKVRFLLAGYPSHHDRRKPSEFKAAYSEYRLKEREPNYGAPPGELSPLPTWLGEAHKFDFTRLNLAYWHKVDRAVEAMRKRGIVAQCIFTIEKQNLPKEYGSLTDNEKLFYRYSVARLAAFENVWWDLGNEHNEYRSAKWAATMGRLVKEWDPFQRLLSAHAYAEWNYGDADWADFIITQQYGNSRETNAWVLKYRHIPKPYVNEEYGYEGNGKHWEHYQDADRVRRCHWGITMAGGFATYGDWGPRCGYYIGEPDQGKAPKQLSFLRRFMEQHNTSRDLFEPDNSRLTNGFALKSGNKKLLGYLPDGGKFQVHLNGFEGNCTLQWFNPRTGQMDKKLELSGGKSHDVTCPDGEDWVFAMLPKGE